MFHDAWNLAIYLSAAALLALGALYETNVTAAVAIAVFLLWDAAFALSPSSFSGRSIEDAQQQIQNTREHISYFLAFYGVLFGVLFTQEPERQQQFLELCRGSGVPLTLLVIPLLLATVPLLFVPIRLSTPNSQEPSSSLKVLLVFSAFMQKSAIFLFIHVVLRILARLGSTVVAQLAAGSRVGGRLMRNVRIEEAERVRSGSLAVVGTRREADVRRETGGDAVVRLEVRDGALTTESVARLAAVSWFAGLIGLLVFVGIPALVFSSIVRVMNGETLNLTRDLWVLVVLPFIVAGQAVVASLLIGFGYWIVRRYRVLTIDRAE